MFAPVSTPAFAIRDVSFFVLGITGVIFVVVAGFAIYTLVRFGRTCVLAARTKPDVVLGLAAAPVLEQAHA